MWGTNKIAGRSEEKRVAALLKSGLPMNNYKILNDLYFEVPFPTQIDHLVISKYGIYVIETKSKSGTVIGRMELDQWTDQYNDNCARTFYSPIKQNETHANAIRKLVSDQGYRNIQMDSTAKNVIVFSNNCQLVIDGQEIGWNMYDTGHAIGNQRFLLQYLSVSAQESPEIFSAEDLDQLENYFKSLNSKNLWKRYKNNRRIQSRYKK